MSANPNLTPATRAERAVEAARLRDEEGLNGIQIAARMGIARSYAYELLNDPDGAGSRTRKKRYAGTCKVCGGETCGTSSGRDRTPSMCRTCATTAYWTLERIIDAIRTWSDEHGGVPPRSLDWGNAANDRNPDFTTGVHPHATTCSHVFGSFNAAIIAAGFEPHRVRDPHRFDDITVDVIVARLRAGEPIDVISSDLGTNANNVLQALYRRGIRILDITGEAATRAERNRRFIELWNNGTPVTEISAELGLTRSSVYGKAQQLRQQGRDLDRPRNRPAALKIAA